jgi:hypothetical protein
MTVGLLGITGSHSLDDNRGEWIFVLKTHIVISYHGECLEEVFAVDTDDILLSFDGSREACETRSDLSITRGDFDLSLVFGSDPCIVVILSRYEIGLFESIGELAPEYD